MFRKNTAMSFILTCLVTFATYTAQAQKKQPLAITEKGLVSYWTLDEIDKTKGGIVTDMIGQNDGHVQGAPKIVKGKYGNALKFDGGRDFIFLTAKGFNSGNQAMSISAWVFKDERGAPGQHSVFVVGPWPDPNNRCFAVWAFTGRRRIDNRINMHHCFKTTLEGLEMPLGQWHHVAAVYDGALKNTFYFDGVEIATEQLETAPDVRIDFDAFPAVIGGNGWRPPGELWEGLIDEVGFYNRALTAAEVSRNFNAPQLFAVEPGGKLSLTWAKIKTSR